MSYARNRTLARTGAAVVATAIAGGAASSGANDPWFRALKKPSFQPPPATFGIVWPILYAGIAFGAARTLDDLEDAGRRDDADAYRRALGANLVLNAGWTWLFFKAKRPGAATAESAVLAVSTVDLVRRGYQDSPGAQVLLAPYVAWTAFATLLAGRISRLNRGSARSGKITG